MNTLLINHGTVYTGDFNGDGRTDLFFKGYGTYRGLYLANATGSYFSRVFMGNSNGTGGIDNTSLTISNESKMYTGDFNGDGKTDLFIKGYNTIGLCIWQKVTQHLILYKAYSITVIIFN